MFQDRDAAKQTEGTWMVGLLAAGGMREGWSHAQRDRSSGGGAGLWFRAAR